MDMASQHHAASNSEQGYEHFENDDDGVDDFSVDVKSSKSILYPRGVRYHNGLSTTKSIIISILVAAVCIGLGVIIGWFSSQASFPGSSETFKMWEAALEESDEIEVTNMILQEMNAGSIREFLRYLTRKPHLAGTPADKENADYIKNLWDSQGLDSTKLVPYDVLLSYPDEEKPNFVNILNENGTILFQSQRKEADLDGNPHKDIVFPFNAYAPAGLVEGELIYVNYARAEDFKKLEDELHINASGKIVLARYGKIFRGNKEHEAWLRGAKGLIIYSDPSGYATEGSSKVYPNTWYLPESGVQRGSIFRPDGDPLTPAYPSTEKAFREREDSVDLPHIPVQPISYGDAIKILREMEGNDVPDEWKGALNVSYKLGPGLANGRRIQLDVNNKNVRRTTYNVIGMIRGSLEPAAACIGLGVVIGWFSSKASFPGSSETCKEWETPLEESDETEVTNMILEEMNAGNIREFLRYMTRKPHLAGTPADKENADYIKNLWDSQGLDTIRLVPYDVLLSYPDEKKPNFVNILNDDGTIFFQSQREEADLDGNPHEDTFFPFNAYAPPGQVEGELIYVNYARAEDFKQLEDELNINVSGKIVLARYGKIYRGNKENEAWLRGAKGLIIYSDPADYAIEGSSEVYPNTWFLPESGVQRGSVFRPAGDPLTPAYPATENAFRESEESVDLPHIPVQPISYGDAIHILREMEGNDVPDEWKGALNVSYKLGPGLINGRKIQLDVNNRNVRRTTYNVIGMIRGSLEPDRYVLVGNHRDAWVFGAVDPSSGTAAMLELSRVLGKLVTEGKWRPRRTIIFCSWGSEEHALIGSTEWAEEFARVVGERAIAYINVDIAVQGNYTFRLKATPNLYDAVFDATKKVSDAPFPGHSSTVYDTWLDRNRDDFTNRPYVSNVGSGSDYAVLLNRLGVSAVDLRYTYDSSLGLSSYPLYHSMYETFHLMNVIMDPSFEYHLALTRVWGELTRSLADSLIIPLKGSQYAFKMRRSLDALKKEYQTQISEKGLSFDEIDGRLIFFTAAAQELEAKIHLKEYENDPFAVRKFNDKLMLMERAFIDPLGLPGQPLVRHVIFAPSSKDSYFGDAFPGITDLLYDINNGQDNDAKWTELEKHMSVVAFTLQSAGTTLIDTEELGIRL